jgi:hypothetical protein
MNIVAKYAEASELIANGFDADEILATCERLEKELGDDPANVLFSEAWERERAYYQIVLEIQSNSDDFIFSLAGHKGETMETLKKKTVSELNSFYERLTKKD